MPDSDQCSSAAAPSVRRVRRRRKRSSGSASSAASATRQRINEQLARRSQEPTKARPKRRRKRSNGKFVLLIVAIIGGFSLALGYSFSVSYHNSQTFKKRLELASAEKTGATVLVKKLEIGATSAFAQSSKWSWPAQQNWLQSCEFYGLNSEHSAFALLTGRWSPRALKSDSGRVDLDFSQPLAKGLEQLQSDSRVSIYTKHLDVYKDGGKTQWIEGAQVNILSDSSKQQAMFNGGVLHSAFFEGYEIDQGLVTYQNNAVKIATRFKEIQGSGRLSLKGEIVAANDQPSNFVLDLEKVDSSKLLSGGLTAHMQAKFSATEGELSYSQSGSYSYRLDAHADWLELKGLDCFRVLSEVISRSAYKSPSFGTKNSVTLVKDDSGYALRNIHFEEEGLLKLKGELAVNNAGHVSGSLELGVPRASKELLRSQFRDGCFTKQADGFVWQTVTVEGGIDGWEDDLRSLLRKSTQNEKQEEKSLEQQFEELLRN